MDLFEKIASKFVTDTNNDGKIDAQDVANTFKSLVSETSDSIDLNGLVEKFKKANLSETVSSWLSNGENKPITAQHIDEVFDTEKLKAFANSLKMEITEAKEMLAKAIPNLVDKFSSDGKLLDIKSTDTTSLLDKIKKLF
ncbi:hypothetical protein W03_18350 [Nitrosomonas sp. PY1]|uniref:YidB family protein n=1 Tax=Nitrosomonas sp. PY1 TaxID=1803906 RepID=UPI001FC8B219|nr:YidB family protein [Nitrosomonas sp. PY1]GKS69831.1 hypothetical protein W03_18350 [Nitrosomonas sp. PY1]